jgi:hypothetical protein
MGLVIAGELLDDEPAGAAIGAVDGQQVIARTQHRQQGG